MEIDGETVDINNSSQGDSQMVKVVAYVKDVYMPFISYRDILTGNIECDRCYLKPFCCIKCNGQGMWRIEVHDYHHYGLYNGKWTECEVMHTDCEEGALDLYIESHGIDIDHYTIGGYKRFFVTISSEHGCSPVGMHVREHAALGQRIYLKIMF